MFNQATLKAQTKKWTKHEAKKAKILEEYNHQISFRADPLPITKISYVVNTNKEETMNITRGDSPLNLIVHPNFRLKSLGFSEWLEVHALASKKIGKLNDMLLQSLREKFQWVMDQAKKLGLPPPPALANFGMTTEEKKRKRTQFLKEAFVTEDISVDGMNRNFIPPLGVVPIEGLVIKEPELSIEEPLSVGLRGNERTSEWDLEAGNSISPLGVAKGTNPEFPGRLVAGDSFPG
ncbi:hypothetical protein Tco_1123760, partial [Tanacetum coccineum]